MLILLAKYPVGPRRAFENYSFLLWECKAADTRCCLSFCSFDNGIVARPVLFIARVLETRSLCTYSN